MATPAFDCLRDSFPTAKIIGILKKNVQGILKDGPWFDAFINCDDKSLSGFRHMVEQIRRHKADMAIVLPNSIRSTLTVWIGGVKKIYGYRRNLRNIFLSGGPKPVRINRKILPIPMTKYYLEICHWIGLNTTKNIKPRLFIGEELRKRAAALLQKYHIRETDLVVGLTPGASFGSSKCWPAEYFAEIAGLCEERFKACVLLFSGPGEENIAQTIIKKTRANIIDTRPDKVDLELLKPLVQRCNLLITNDTGPRHYAVAFDVPVVVIIGPTDPRYTNTNLDYTIILRKELSCSPCHKKVCPTRHKCMREITPDEVFSAATKLLGACN